MAIFYHHLSTTHRSRGIFLIKYLFGDYERKNCQQIITPSPAGSNFIAALAASTKHLGVNVKTEYFQPHFNQHIHVQKLFSQHYGIDSSSIHQGHPWISASKAYLKAKKHTYQNGSYFIHPGERTFF